MTVRVLVTGGAGFIGSHVVDELLQAGFEPYVVDDLSSGRRENLPQNLPFYHVDIRDAQALAGVFAEVRPRFVSHQAAQISVSRSVREPRLDAEVNIVGLLNVLELSARFGVERVTFASSGGVLYGDVSTPAGEEHPAQPISPYGISKWAGEQYLQFFAREHGLQTVALRYANVYGPRQNPHGEAGVVAIFAQRLLAGEGPTIFGDGTNVRDYVFVGDVARANLLSFTRQIHDKFLALNIGTGVGTDVNTLYMHLRTTLAATLRAANRGRELPAATYGPPRPGDLRSSLLSVERARAVLGWQPEYDLVAGLRRTVEWFVQ